MTQQLLAPPRVAFRSPTSFRSWRQRRLSHIFDVFSLVFLCCIASGCTLSRPVTNASPIAFNTRPNLAQVIDAVNANSSRVQQLHSDRVRLSIPGQIGTLNATLDFERSTSPNSPGRFRLSGEALGARQLDLGSNDREYWMWVKQNQPPTVFWGRHAEFYQSAAPQFLPMPPSWIVDAMGLVMIDPNGFHQGPYESPTTGLLQVISRIPTPRGDLKRILEIDKERALIVQQLIYDSADQLLAIADASNFNYDTLNSVSLPRTVRIKLPPAGLAFNFEVETYTINQPALNPMSLWSMPQIPEHQYRNLANPAEMQGINLMGANPDFYDSQATVSQAVRPQTPRAAWRRLPPFNVFR